MQAHHRITVFVFISGIIATIIAAIAEITLSALGIVGILLSTALPCYVGFKLTEFLSNNLFRYTLNKDIPKNLQYRGIVIFSLILISITIVGFFLFLTSTAFCVFWSAIIMCTITYKYAPDSALDLERDAFKNLGSGLQRVNTVHPDVHLSDFGSRDVYSLGNSRTYSKNSVIPVGDADYNLSDTSHGSAHWIPDKQKESLTDRDEKSENPLYRGLWLGGGFFHHKEGNLLTVAPPGKGKGAALIIPNLLWHREYKHSFVVFDPKGTNACITANFQQSVGQKVVIIDPMGLQKLSNASHNIQSSSFNALDFITDDIFNGAGQIASLLLPDGSVEDRFWTNRAKDLLLAVIMHVMTYPKYKSERNFVTIYKLVRGGDLISLFEEMVQNTDEKVGEEIRTSGKDFDLMHTQNMSAMYSVLSFATNALSWVGNPEVQKCILHSDFQPCDIGDGGVSLYLCQPIHNREQFSAFSRLIVGAILRENAKTDNKSKAWVYYLLDEFPSMGCFPEIITSMAISREYKMRIWIFAQSLSQLDSVYGSSTRETIIGTSNILQAFGVTDRLTQEYISARIGSTTVISNKISQTSTVEKDVRQIERSKSMTVTRNSDTLSRRLLNEEEIEREPNIITLTEWGPMRLSRWQYWQSPIEKISKEYSKIFSDGRADANPNFK